MLAPNNFLGVSMRAFLFLCPLVVASIASGKAADAKGFYLKTAFEYQTGEKTTKTENTSVLDANYKGWTTLVPPKDGVTLLGKLIENENKTVQVEYMVIDTNRPNALVSTPSVIARPGEAAHIESVDSRGQRVSVQLIATPANTAKAE
jgi:hypothetical protein